MKKVSKSVLVQRQANLPRPVYKEDLPIIAMREEIMLAIEKNQVVIICGETGSGKTTQLPKICLEVGRGVAGMIGHTQPRRIAARTVASRIAAELNSPLGQAVGYKVRFTDKVSTDTYIKLMTDGILLAETQGDGLLQAYDTLIIDEAHERSLNIDFLLGYIQQLLSKRPDLKLIVTSATIDAQRFSKHFNNAPVIEVAGRTYPVEIRYRPISDERKEDNDLQQAIVNAVDEVSQIGSGDVLVFLPGEREIKETAETLRKHYANQQGVIAVDILPLFARLSVAQQQRIFEPSGRRRIVLATNVAETSLTVPGIHYVVDTGLVRINRYSYRNKVTQLQIEKVSQASANQRSGRCGRVASGVCIRLYGEEDYQVSTEFTDPEILRTSLAAVILTMKSLKIGDVEHFPFLEPPSPRMIADGYQLLTEIGAVDENKRLTSIGRQLAKFPIDPKIARMILAAKTENCLNEILLITAALSMQDPRDRPFEKQDAADKAHKRFQDERSDFMSYLKIWEFFEECVKNKESNRHLVAQCQDNFISHRRMREWREIHSQLKRLVREMGFKLNTIAASYDEIHRALLTGLLGNIGFKAESDRKENEYLGARGIKFAIFPGSVLKKGKTKWVVAAELVETTKLYARCVAKIDPSWLENIAGSLCKKHYFNPHWAQKPAQVIAFERVTLYGLTLIPKRHVHYGKINPQVSRELFIQSALVSGEYETNAPFFVHNRTLLDELESLEHKARRQDVLVDEQKIFEFYDAIIPATIVNGAGFEKWRKQAEKDNSQVLFLDRDYLMRHAANQVTEIQFPEHLVLDEENSLPLSYRFEPGHVLDGVTATLPLSILNQLKSTYFDYLVPGMIREKVTWYFKALPKQLRRHLVPLPDSVTQFLQTQPTGSLLDALVKFVLRKSAMPMTAEVWADKVLPPHLLMNLKVVDDAGQELAMHRDLVSLQAELGQMAQSIFPQFDSSERISIERDNIVRWDFGVLPETIEFVRRDKRLIGYPALSDESSCVAIRIFDTQAKADEMMRAGVRRLLLLELKDRIKKIERNLPGFRQPILQLSSLIDPNALKQDIVEAIADHVFIGDKSMPHDEHAYNQLKQHARIQLPLVTENLASMLQDIAGVYQMLAVELSASGKGKIQVCNDIKIQLKHLIYKGFLKATPWEKLQHFSRYLNGMLMRLDSYSKNPNRDKQHELEVAKLWEIYINHREKNRELCAHDQNLNEFRWQIEELRISLFAQKLKTPFPVSVKRLEKLWDGL